MCYHDVYIPNTNIVIKCKKHWFAKLINHNITVGTYILTPDEMILNSVILHELTHMLDSCKIENGYAHKKWYRTLWWYIKYMFPQNLAIFSLLGFANLWFLLFLLALLPLPYLNTFRLNAEIKGYFYSLYYPTNWSNINQKNRTFKSLMYFKMIWVDKSNKWYNDRFLSFNHSKIFIFIDKNVKFNDHY